MWHPRCSCVPTTFRNRSPCHRVAPTLLMCADHLPQHESMPPCGTNAAHVCRPPSATRVHATVWHPRCSCVPTTFRNRCLGHRVAPTLLMCADHLPQHESMPPCGTNAAHVCRPPSATGVHATVWHPRCSCVPTTFRNRSPCHRVAPTLLMCADHLPQQESMPPCGTHDAHVCRPPSATGVHATALSGGCSGR